MPKVSIILPVYNVAEYLEQCLDSLINQTLKDIEIICINDGSTDNSLEILNQYVKKDSRIKVINKQNGGQGIARNLGIDIASGEFIGFADPDDWVDSEMYEQMYNQAKALSSQIVICGYKKYFEQTGKFVASHIFRIAVSLTKSKSLKVPSQQNINKELLNKTVLVSPAYAWNAIYNSSLLKDNNIKFSIMRCYEDVMFVLKSRILADKVSYIDSAFYNYRIRTSSTLRANDSRYIDLINVIKLLKDYLVVQDLITEFKYNFNYFCVANIYRVFSHLNSDELRRHLLDLSEEILDENLLKELQKKFLVSIPLLKDFVLNPLQFKQKFSNLFYYKKYL